MDELKKLLENAGVAEADGWDSERYDDGPLTPDDDPDFAGTPIGSGEPDGATQVHALNALSNGYQFDIGDTGKLNVYGPERSGRYTKVGQFDDFDDMLHNFGKR